MLWLYCPMDETYAPMIIALRIGAASTHFSPIRSRTASSDRTKSPQYNGAVTRLVSETAFKKPRLSRSLPWPRAAKVGNATACTLDNVELTENKIRFAAL